MSEKNYGLRIIKIPLGRDIKIGKLKFPPLKNLELNLLENPKLLKDGVSLIPLKPIKPVKLEDEAVESIDIPQKERKSKYKRKKKEKDELEALGSDTDSDVEDEAPPKRKSKKTEIQEESSDDEESSGEESSDEEESDDEDEKLSPEEKEAQDRAELTRKIKILKKQYPGRDGLQINEFTDIKTLKRTYDDELWDIHIDECVDNYRIYLMIACMGLEHLGTNWFGMDMAGLTKHHMRRREKYDRLLIELGEKSYSKLGANLPVEIRLVGLVLIETLVFYVGKQIFGKGDQGVAQFFAAMTGTGGGGKGKPNPGERVKGPSITPDEIRKMAEGT